MTRLYCFCHSVHYQKTRNGDRGSFVLLFTHTVCFILGPTFYQTCSEWHSAYTSMRRKYLITTLRMRGGTHTFRWIISDCDFCYAECSNDTILKFIIKSNIFVIQHFKVKRNFLHMIKSPALAENTHQSHSWLFKDNATQVSAYCTYHGFSPSLRPISTGFDVVEDIVFVSRHLQVLTQLYSCLYIIHSKIPCKKDLHVRWTTEQE